jgi:hypothetical protein
MDNCKNCKHSGNELTGESVGNPLETRMECLVLIPSWVMSETTCDDLEDGTVGDGCPCFVSRVER